MSKEPWDNPTRLIEILEDEDASRKERVKAANRVAILARMRSFGGSAHRTLFDRVVLFWRGLCEAEEDPSWPLLMDRTRAASACTLLSLDLSEGQKFFKNIPRVGNAEGPHPRIEGEIIRGAFNYMYRSIYEFHREYPIEGFGVRKDLISVIEEEEIRTPMFDWLREQDVVVWCSGCGLEVTYEVSRNCPARFLIAQGRRSRSSRPILEKPQPGP